MKSPEHLNRLFPGFRHPRASPAFATDDDFDKRFLCLAVHGIHHVPGAAIGHVHRLGGLGDRTVFADPLEQDRPPVAEKGARGAVDPDAAAQAGFPSRRRGVLRMGMIFFPVRHGRNISEGIAAGKKKIVRAMTGGHTVIRML